MQPAEIMFGSATDPSEVCATLEARYRLHIGPPTAGNWTCLDTADWRLHRAGMTLRDAHHGRRGELRLSAPGASIVAPSPGRRWPRRIETLPASPVRDRIAAPVGVRALLPLADVAVRSIRLRLLDDNDKTRVRVQVDQQRLAAADHRSALPLRVQVAPLRGYERDGERCAELLRSSMHVLAGADSAVVVALAAAGRVPGEPIVPALELDPAAPAVASLAAVFARWMDVIDAVRPGVLADIDIEYLHDLRTAVRATRSLMRLGAELLPASQAEQFAAEFAWLGTVTAPVRDLDVALLELAGRGGTDVSGLADLDPLHAQLASRRRRAVRTMRHGLASPRATTLSARWRTALRTFEPRVALAPNTHDAAAGQATAAYRRIVKAARAVSSETPADELHRLRGRCKRMRYLLDGYASVYTPHPHRRVLTALKRLQDCLGEIQDVDVQCRQLRERADAIAANGGTAATVMAMGALRDRILRRDAAARRTLERKLTAFCSPATARLVAGLGGAAA